MRGKLNFLEATCKSYVTQLSCKARLEQIVHFTFHFSLFLKRKLINLGFIISFLLSIPSYAREPFADITRVSGVDGVYIASVQQGNTLTPDAQLTLITFDKVLVLFY